MPCNLIKALDVRKCFSDKDSDGGGSLDAEEFKNMMTDPTVQRKLTAIGISVDDTEELFQVITTNSKSSTITADEMVEAFLKLRDPSQAGSRGVNVLRQVFQQADVDKGGTLNRDEVRQFVCNDAVTSKLQKLKLPVPDWLGLFDQIDCDGDGQLSWPELLQGVGNYWKELEAQETTRRISDFQH